MFLNQKPGQSQTGIPTWTWPFNTRLTVSNAGENTGRVRFQAGTSPAEEQILAGKETEFYERPFGGAYLTVTNIGSTTLTAMTN
ncbi:hypothetical protein PPL_11560 [Heterostelium album PN500]|uniref:Uncharacterized protein n=1 Tax=Heterostelium pallidum (strain ATCC 26659 / Pp 5 / PN500) TaxID=670386 RepID=D3BVG9_HETP5|nr:hypothetical protein PPL_11560 [Heterostelium album PN500]EFA74592.1 hypothetical protein PPL_11560 [Heterostelium album PN500]|eukprot:XP_020426726.1 hypothetical protein PPL_11560 [Heterostelium album PN500]